MDEHENVDADGSALPAPVSEVAAASLAFASSDAAETPPSRFADTAAIANFGAPKENEK